MIQFNLSGTILTCLAAACCLQLTGCASYHHENRTVYHGSSSDWRSPGNDKQIEELVFNKQVNKENRLTVTFNKVEYDKEYSSDIYHNEIKLRKDPDLGKILISSLLLWMPCVIDKKKYNSCFGGSGNWIYSSEEIKNTRATGKTRPVTRPLKKNYDTLVALISYDEKKQRLDTGYLSVYSAKSSINFDLKDAIETLPNKPNSLDIAVDISINGQSYYKKWPINQQTLNSITTNSDRWLPLSVRKDKYMDALRTALLSDNHTDAVTQFEKIEALNIALPESFYFKYGISLSKAGHPAKAKQYFTRYISNTGQEGRYYSQARELLDN